MLDASGGGNVVFSGSPHGSWQVSRIRGADGQGEINEQQTVADIERVPGN